MQISTVDIAFLQLFIQYNQNYSNLLSWATLHEHDKWKCLIFIVTLYTEFSFGSGCLNILPNKPMVNKNKNFMKKLKKKLPMNYDEVEFLSVKNTCINMHIWQLFNSACHLFHPNSSSCQYYQSFTTSYRNRYLITKQDIA